MYMGSGAALAAYLRRTRVEALDRCAAACGTMSRHCLELARRGGADCARHALASGLARDCGEICNLAAGLMARESGLAHHALLACARACRLCAEVCEESSTNPIFAECLGLCRESEAICDRSLGRQTL